MVCVMQNDEERMIIVIVILWVRIGRWDSILYTARASQVACVMAFVVCSAIERRASYFIYAVGDVKMVP